MRRLCAVLSVKRHVSAAHMQHTYTDTHTHTDIRNIATLHKLQVCVCTWSQSTYTFIFLSGLCVHMIYNNVTAAHKRDGGGGRGGDRREAGEEQALKFFL